MPNKAVRIKNAFTLEEIEDGIGSKEEELYTVNFQGKKIIVPWWADTLVVDRLNNLVAFPGIPIMVARQTDKWFWRSTDCEGFQVHGLVDGEVEIEEGRGCTPLDGIFISLACSTKSSLARNPSYLSANNPIKGVTLTAYTTISVKTL